MQHLDLQVVNQAIQWLESGQPVWLCTVLSTFGSSPREPGSMMVACREGEHVGSLSGGCVEEDFLERLGEGVYDQPVTLLRYGDSNELAGPRIRLPCGGILEVLVERLEPTAPNRQHLQTLRTAMLGQCNLVRRVSLSSGQVRVDESDGMGPRVFQDLAGEEVSIGIGPVAKLIIAGISSVSEACAEFAQALGYEVVVCDPREEEIANFRHSSIQPISILPSLYIASEGACHALTAVVALTHDPRIDDLAMMAAVRTPAFYIGVMGSHRTSRARADRLIRSGGLSDADIARLHMPIGLALGSKTPAEIALAVMADILRVRRGRELDAL